MALMAGVIGARKGKRVPAYGSQIFISIRFAHLSDKLKQLQSYQILLFVMCIFLNILNLREMNDLPM